MTNKEFLQIANLYGYTLNKYTIEGFVFDDEEVPLNISEIQKPLPKQILAISAELENSEDIFAIFLDENNPTLSGVVAIEFLQLGIGKETLLDLKILDFYVPTEEI